nr:sulfotransferase [Rhodovulum tesquicola]
MICSERSGSNLISAMMGAHSGIYSHPPYHLGRDILLNLPRTLAGGVTGPAWKILCAHAVERVRKYRNPAEADRLEAWFSARDRIDPVEIAAFLWQELPEEAKGRHVFVKENNLHHLLPFLLTAFPDAKYVFQTRDPRDFLASAKALRKRWMGNKFGSLRQALTIWRDDQKGGLAALALLGPERVCLVRYEDLVSDASVQLERVCAFLGLAFEPAMLDFHASDAARRVAATIGARENIAKPLMTGNFRKYRKSLSRRDIRSTEAFLGDLMDQLGYPCDYPRRPGRPSFWPGFRPQLTEMFERLANKEIGPFYKHGQRSMTRALDAATVPLCPPIPDTQDRA